VLAVFKHRRFNSFDQSVETQDSVVWSSVGLISLIFLDIAF